MHRWLRLIPKVRETNKLNIIGKVLGFCLKISQNVPSRVFQMYFVRHKMQLLQHLLILAFQWHNHVHRAKLPMVSVHLRSELVYRFVDASTTLWIQFKMSITEYLNQLQLRKKDLRMIKTTPVVFAGFRNFWKMVYFD